MTPGQIAFKTGFIEKLASCGLQTHEAEFVYNDMMMKKEAFDLGEFMGSEQGQRMIPALLGLLGGGGLGYGFGGGGGGLLGGLGGGALGYFLPELMKYFTGGGKGGNASTPSATPATPATPAFDEAGTGIVPPGGDTVPPQNLGGGSDLNTGQFPGEATPPMGGGSNLNTGQFPGEATPPMGGGSDLNTGQFPGEAPVAPQAPAPQAPAPQAPAPQAPAPRHSTTRLLDAEGMSGPEVTQFNKQHSAQFGGPPPIGHFDKPMPTVSGNMRPPKNTTGSTLASSIPVQAPKKPIYLAGR